MRWNSLILMALTLITTVLDGFGLALFLPLIETMDADQTSRSPVTNWFHLVYSSLGIPFELPYIIAGIVCIYGLKGCMLFCEVAFAGWQKSRLAFSFRTRFVESFSNSNFSFLAKQDSGVLSHIAGGELTDSVNSIFLFVSSASCLLTVFTYIIVASFVNPFFTLVTILLTSMSALILRVLNRKAKLLSASLVKQQSSFQGFVTENLQNAKYLLATGTIQKTLIKLRIIVKSLSSTMFKLSILKALVKGLREPILVTSLLALVGFHSTFSEAPVTSVIFILLLVYRSLTNFMAYQVSWQTFLATSSSIDLVTSKIAELEKNVESNGATRITEVPSTYELLGVSYKYGDFEALKGVNLKIDTGQLVAILGESGSGKSTLVNILTGLFVPTSGQVLVDGVDLRELDKKSYRRHLGYITQESVIFNDSMKNNIMLWTEGQVPESIIKKTALDFGHNREGGMDGPVGDRGGLISGGQRQRIGLARELFRNIDLLILDEATSSLDHKTADVIRKYLRKMKGSKTIVLVTHNVNHALDADSVLILDKGAVVESGNLQLLMANKASTFSQYLNSVKPE